MKIRTNKKKKIEQPKRKVLVVQPSEDDELIEREGLAVSNKGIYVVESEEEDSPVKETNYEYVARVQDYRVVPRVITTKGIDPEKIYGIECRKKDKFNVRVVRPASGLELLRSWRNIFDFGAVHYFPTSRVRDGYRLLQLPDGDLCVAIRSWHGFKYVPKDIQPKRVLKFGKPQVKIKFKSKETKRVKIKFGKPIKFGKAKY